MKNKDSVLHELDKIESISNQLNFIVKQGQSIEAYMDALSRIRESVDQARLYVESEQNMYN
jgi:hypothetical protein